MMELLDVLNESGQKIGETLDREVIHQKGLWHQEISVWILNQKGQVLIQKRSPDKTINPNMWGLCAGHVSAGEDPITTAQKELAEEVGLIKNINELKFLTTQKKERKYQNGLANRIFNDVFYVFTNKLISDFKIQKEELSEIKWIDYLDLKKKFFDQDPKLAINLVPENIRMFELLDQIYSKIAN